MIPQVCFSEESDVEKVKARIVACRRRLRTVRVHRIRIQAEQTGATEFSTAISGLASYPGGANLQFTGYPKDDGT